MKWEQVDDTHTRAKVFGGWIFKVTMSVAHESDRRGIEWNWDTREAVCFIPDPNHEWKLNPQEDGK